MKSMDERGIEDLLHKLDFSPETVVESATKNAQLFMQAVDLRVKALRAHNAAKMALDNRRAEIGLSIRQTIRDSGEKVTEDYVKSQLAVNDNILLATAKVDEAEEMEEYAKMLVEAFRMRRDCMKIVADMTRDEASLRKYIDANTEEFSKTRQALANKYPGGK